MKDYVVTVALVVGCLFMMGRAWGIREERGKATEAGVGYYKVDPQTGATEFVYGVKGAGDDQSD